MLSEPVTVTAPVAAVMNLETVKLFVRVDGSELDAEIQAYMDAAVADIERLTSTRLGNQVVEVRADSFDDLMHLQVGPVSSVVSINYDDIAGSPQIVAANTYELFGAGLERGIRPRFGAAWPSARNARGAISVQLQVGYATLPASIGLALLLAIRGRFDGSAVDLPMLLINDRIWG
ncbi:MAG: phage head-tail connector protein [Sphingobium sp.]|uniref:head-tail connector protein n=1 Tax=Sphingobium sp. TaxID=1912891 RepID=UPI0029BE0C1A|nr:phage head-tail connector protein [Sphingobium sp.]MDX3908418.1 phage head-tail connector protein [Sphingobium sp.]